MRYWPLRRVVRAIWIITAIGLLAALPMLVLEFKHNNFSVHYTAWFVAGIFVLLALPVSFYEVAMHLEHFTRPKLQIRVIRILWMVPVYAVDSFVALRYVKARLYLDPIRECYEAFVIFNFYMYLIAYLEDEYGDIDAYFSTKPDVPHLNPMHHCLPTWANGYEFFWACKKGVLNYVIVRPLMTAVSVVAQLLGVYHEGQLRYDGAWTYVAVINNISQAWALYCLILMYLGCKEELAPIRPMSKFLVVKAVVFASYWQGVLISILVAIGVIKTSESWTTYDADDVGAGLQDFLICIEMFFAALAHAYAFPPRDYMDPACEPAGFLQNLRVMFDVTDVVDDVHVVVDDTVQNTRENIAQVTHTTWRTTKRATTSALQKPMGLLRVFSRGKNASGSSSDGEERERALLQYPSQDSVDGHDPSSVP